MQCNRIRVRNFRNIEEADVTFHEGVNVLFGNNAQGKTNLLEAIYFSALGKSFRKKVSQEDLIRFGCDEAEISLDFSDSIRRQNLTSSLTRGKQRRVTLNRIRLEKLSEALGAFRTVLFCPEHLSIVKGGPEERRSFLDVAISQLRPVYTKALQRYNQIKDDRNRLLKTALYDRSAFDATISVWSEQLAAEGAQIARLRSWYVRELNERVKVCFAEMTDGAEIPELRYQGSAGLSAEDYERVAPVEARYRELLSGSLEREIQLGSTQYGPHKDELAILLDGKPAYFGSQGQCRSLALAMKLAEGEICRKESGECPVYLLDDVVSELDPIRRAYLFREIRGKQVIITSCERLDGEELCAAANKIRVEKGSYLQEEPST
jgi:DNA replication and repair protein RecF